MLTIEKIFTPKSSNVEIIAYDPTFCHLFVTFKSGKTYRYISVEGRIFEEFKEILKNDESIGKFYIKNVKGKYEWALIN